jgi:hypothetical protein
MKGKKNNNKQTVQFNLEDIRFFKQNKMSTLVCLPSNASASVIMTADSATLRLNNQNNGWKGICVQEAGGKWGII